MGESHWGKARPEFSIKPSGTSHPKPKKSKKSKNMGGY